MICDNCWNDWAVSAPDRTAIIYENDESTYVKRITFKEFLRETCRVASSYNTTVARRATESLCFCP